MDTLHIKPVGGLVVRDPITLAPLPEEGAEKPANAYWLRRLADADVESTPSPETIRRVMEGEPTATTAAPTAAPTATTNKTAKTGKKATQ
jgi:hypothetical protein